MNATYTSSSIQNEIVDIIGNHIIDTTVRRVKEAKCFSVIADEVTDASNKEILSLVLRCVNPEDGQVREDLVDFLKFRESITGQALSDMILDKLGSYGLDLGKCVVSATMALATCLGRTWGQQLSSPISTHWLCTCTAHPIV